ncbi:capsule assembly Wzi family protein [Parapedobacter tibetensis]|uniref:capsule assembly Wzi family protein n=1 Tax=Parapedobacter tibetensis TaxID=2972951 RepID=UPI00214DB63F|nr:capsule assembly Wzi family protein [Parapedobacter tibetensis]
MKKIGQVRLIIFGLLLSVITIKVEAQVLPVGTPLLEDYYRRAQLLGLIDSSISFNVRPLSASALQVDDIYNMDREESSSIVWRNDDNSSMVQLMPAIIRYQYNSKYPYGWNDGAMIPARGHQTMLSAGIFAKYKFFSVQLNPEVVLAENKRYEGYGGVAGLDRAWYNFIGNRIDMPELFGTGAYSRILPGQSSIRVTFDPISLGISTENLWWGPSRRNSILMSNTAPGFAHITLNTTKPIRTYIGSFEGQIVAGRIELSGYPPSLLGDTSVHMQYLRDKTQSWRYFSGIVLSYQPRWIPGLSLGMNRAFLTDNEMTGHSLSDYLPFIIPATKKSVTDDSESGDSRDQQISFFFRWVIPKAHAEIYGEYARNDHAWDTRDLTVQLDHTRAYTVGLRKLVPLQGVKGAMLQLSGEVTQLAVTNTRRIRAAGPWYFHGHHGYTHRGQILGAGIGPGSNVQSVDISWIKGLKQVGLQFERLVHNEDFARGVSADFRRNWVDASIAAYSHWDYKGFIASAHIQYIHAYNYQYKFSGSSSADEYWDFDPQDNTNFNIRLGLMYRF